MEFIIKPSAPKFKKIYQPKPKANFATPLKAHIDTVLELMSEVYDYTTFETSFAKQFNIPKRTLKNLLEPSLDYQISDFAKGVVKVYNSKLLEDESSTI